MIPAHARDTYRRIEGQAHHTRPEKLIHLLYERGLQHLRLAGEAIGEGNPKKRGENLGKVIAIVSELNASLDMDKGKEAAVFLRGLYEAILLELSRVAITNDLEVVKRSYRYLKRLKEIWEQTAMKEARGQEQAVSPASPGKAADSPARSGGIDKQVQEHVSVSV